MTLNTNLLDKIADRIYDDVIHSEELNVYIDFNKTFEIDENDIKVTYRSILRAYDFMVISGKIESLDVTINDEPCLHIEEKYITDKVNELLN